MKARYQAVWFDLDGTLFDTAPDLIATVNRTLAEHGYPPAAAGVILPYTGHGSRQMLQHALSTTTDDPRLPALQEAFYAHYLRHVAEETRWFPGMAAIVDDLDACNVPWGIITNKLERFTYALTRHFALDQRVAAIVCGDTLATAKPDPAPLAYACALAGVRPEQAVMVGDSAADIRAAARAGMPSIYCDYGYTSRADLAEDDRPIAFVDSPAALAPLLFGDAP